VAMVPDDCQKKLEPMQINGTFHKFHDLTKYMPVGIGFV
jgi:hypothetical protein